MSKTYSTRKEPRRRFSKKEAQEWVKKRNSAYRRMGSSNRAEYRYLISEYTYGVFVRRKRK